MPLTPATPPPLPPAPPSSSCPPCARYTHRQLRRRRLGPGTPALLCQSRRLAENSGECAHRGSAVAAGVPRADGQPVPPVSSHSSSRHPIPSPYSGIRTHVLRVDGRARSAVDRTHAQCPAASAPAHFQPRRRPLLARAQHADPHTHTHNLARSASARPARLNAVQECCKRFASCRWKRPRVGMHSRDGPRAPPAHRHGCGVCCAHGRLQRRHVAQALA